MRTLVVPVVGAWDANDSYVLVVPKRPARIEGLEPARRGQWGSPYAVEPHVSTSCLSIGRVLLCDSRHGNGVTVEDEDGTDIPAELPVFNTPGHSDPVDQGLPSATSSLRMRAQSHSSYSCFQLHVNGEASSSDFGTLTGFVTWRRVNVLAVTAFSFCRWWPWSSTEYRANGVAKSGVTFSLLNLFLTI